MKRSNKIKLIKCNLEWKDNASNLWIEKIILKSKNILVACSQVFISSNLSWRLSKFSFSNVTRAAYEEEDSEAANILFKRKNVKVSCNHI